MILALPINLEPVVLKSPPKWKDVAREEVREMIDASIRKEISKVHTLTEDGERWKIEIIKIVQKNRDPSDILNSPGKAGSRTEVQILFTRPGKADEKLNGEAGGSFFGTTDRWEMSGGPDDKARMIRVVAKQRAEAIGKAVWNAVGRSS